jgi:hypothetical protein
MARVTDIGHLSLGARLRTEHCFGNKRCVKGSNNSNRWLCPIFCACLERFVLRRLEVRESPLNIARELMNEVWLNASPYIALHLVGRVAMQNGFRFGRKKIDRAIRELGINGPVEPREIRFVFGVYGRSGCARPKTTPIGLTEANQEPKETTNNTKVESLIKPPENHSLIPIYPCALAGGAFRE